MDDLNFEDLVDGAINSAIDEATTERFEAQKLFQPKARKGLKTPVLSGKDMASPSRGGVKHVDDDTMDVPDQTARMTDPPGPEPPLKPVGPTASFEHVYLRAGVESGKFTVFRLEELYNDEDLAALDASARITAVRAILKSHGVELEEIVDDALARRGALDTHDARLRSNIERVEGEMQAENDKLQNEIEEFASPRLLRMDKNQERVERLRRDYRDWYERRQIEQDRIVAILEPWGTDDRLRATQKVEAPPVAAAAPAPMQARAEVSRSEAFEPAIQKPAAVRQDLVDSLDSGQWDFSDAESEGPAKRSAVSSAPAGATSTGEFDFVQPRLRMPRSPLQGLVAGIAVVSWPAAGILLTAQLSFFQPVAAMGVALGAPLVLAIIVSTATRASNRFGSGLFTMLLVFSLIAFVGAHADPANLVKNLTNRPLWFIDEAGLSAGVERSVFALTGPYATAIAPLLGVESAIARAEADSSK